MGKQVKELSRFFVYRHILTGKIAWETISDMKLTTKYKLDRMFWMSKPLRDDYQLVKVDLPDDCFTVVEPEEPVLQSATMEYR